MIEWAGHGLVLIGVLLMVAAVFFRSLPYIGSNTNSFVLVSAILMSIGFFIEGYSYSNLKHRVEKELAIQEQRRLAQLVDTAQRDSKEKNTQVETTVKQTAKKIVKRQAEIKEKIVEVEKIINKECTIVPEAVDLHNLAAEPPK